MGLQEFLDHMTKVSADFFATIKDTDAIQHITHLDSDGLSSGAIVVEMLHQKDLNFCTRVLPTLEDSKIADIVSDRYTHYIFSDLGSGQMGNLVQYLSDKIVLILDHHEIEDVQMPQQWFHVNPRDFGIDGSAELSASGVCYLFAKQTMDSAKHLAGLSMLGATGDVQDKTGQFIGVNKEILDDALNSLILEKVRTLKYFGVSSSNLTYLLDYGKDVYIPGVTGVKGGGATFLEGLGIHHEIGGKPLKLGDLSQVEFNRLVQAIITKRKDEPNADDVLCDIYELPYEEKGSRTKNLKEFSALLNACGRMQKYAVGIGTCLADPDFRELSTIVYSAYKQKISQSIRWFKAHNHEKTDKYLIINGGNEVPATMIGTLASIVARMPEVTEGMYIISVARNNEEDITKLSVRVAGDAEGYDLNEFIRGVCDGLDDVQAGGHSFAAGAVLPQSLESEVLDRVKKALSNDSVATQKPKEVAIAEDVL